MALFEKGYGLPHPYLRLCLHLLLFYASIRRDYRRVGAHSEYLMDGLLLIIKLIACVGILAFGLIALMRPEVALRLIQLEATSARGIAETRVNFGGFFIGLGSMPILLQSQAAFQVAGVAYLAAVASRAIGYLLDRPPLDGQYIGLFMFELAMGVALLV